MADKSIAPLVYLPESLQQFLQICKKNPEVFIHAGGTYKAYRQQPEPAAGSGIVHIGNIGELKRITRTDRYLEIGAGASLNQVLNIGEDILPQILYQAVRQIANYSVRNLATIGGHLCVRQQRLDLFPALTLLDARVELRKGGSSRWLQPGRLFDETNNCSINPGEVLTRIRIPLESWDIQVFKKISSRNTEMKGNFIFAGRAKIQKGLIQDFRFCFGGINRSILRDKTIEAEATGKKLPLLQKNMDTLISVLEKNLDAQKDRITLYQRKQCAVILKSFLDYLSEEQ